MSCELCAELLNHAFYFSAELVTWYLIKVSVEENFLSALSTNKMETDKLEQSPMATILSNLEDFLAGKTVSKLLCLKVSDETKRFINKCCLSSVAAATTSSKLLQYFPSFASFRTIYVNQRASEQICTFLHSLFSFWIMLCRHVSVLGVQQIDWQWYIF